jgi:hypothetical protein
MISLFVVFEGSTELGPVPICRVTNSRLTRRVTAFALAKTTQTAEAMRIVDDEASSEASCEVDRLRAVLATV